MSDLRLDDRGVIITCPSCARPNRIAYARLDNHVRCAQCRQHLSAPSEPIDVASTDDFDHLVAQASVPVVVDFWATWCGPCRMVAPELRKVAERQAGRMLVVKVDTDALPDLSHRFGIRSIPTMAVFVKGREAARSAGARPAQEIEAFIDQAVHAFHR